MRVHEVRDFSKRGDALPIPNLIDIQIESYQRFLQKEVEANKRKNDGLEALLREVFPIESYDGNLRLEYISYDLAEPRYTTDECRALRLTFGMPFRIQVRLIRKDKDEVMEDSIYLGEIPIMIGGGEFIINGAERVIVSPLHRSPGVDFLVEVQEGARPLHGCRIIPERGSWIECSVTKKDVLAVRIDQSSKIPATTFLRALDEKYSTTEAIIREFYTTENVKVGQLQASYYAASPIIDAENGEEIVKAGAQIAEALNKIQSTSLKSVECVTKVNDPLILNTLAEDTADSHKSALLKIYARLRPIDELASEELRKGFLKLRRTVQERMSLKDPNELGRIAELVNSKSISSAIDFFFGRGELSQVVDQTNPLSQLTHERRLSALGPGGLNRKRAGFEVRDVHISHYGRICPIETPEGTNIGLISSLAIYASVDEYGFLISPYRKVNKGKLPDEIVWLRPDEEADAYVAPADTAVQDGKIVPGPALIARHRSDFEIVAPEQVQFIDVAPSQMVGVSAGLIPFLEHDDANRALMGSNMQRQAVPLLVTEPPIVATGMEKDVARNSSMVVRARKAGKVTFVDAGRIEIGTDVYPLKKFQGLNERTCLNQKPIIKPGDKVEKGQVIADGAATFNGELALGRNVLVGFMSFDGYNFEDAIILSEELVKNDTYTSLHIEEFDVEIRETKLGREEFTRDIPNVSEKALRNLDETGIVRVGTFVKPGDILVGKVSPKSKTELTPEEKLLHAIFGRAGEDVKNDSLEVPSGIEGIVIDTQKFSRRMSLSEDERKKFEKELKEAESEGNKRIAQVFGEMVEGLEKAIGKTLTDEDGTPIAKDQDPKFVGEKARNFKLQTHIGKLRSEDKIEEAEKLYKQHWPSVEEAIDACDRVLNSMKRGDELRSGVLQMVKVYIATKRVISVGDKMAGRHGNKGVIAKILPVEDMPFLPDGTPIQIMLNPLGVPSRMNVGQILETHLGWAAALLGFQAVTPVFDGATEKGINDLLAQAGLPAHGKLRLHDGRTGEEMQQETTVGFIYMLKLHHLVDDKVHARSTGPYSLITQQPLGGKARVCGQRFVEMAEWALEAYVAAYVLHKLLTGKSDDVEGRTKIYESMVKGENTLEAGTPASFDVLTNEIRGLALNMQLEKKRI